MKKIFAISMLAIFAIGAARAEWSPAYDYNNGNLNIATVKLVQEYAVPQGAVVDENVADYAAQVQSTGETAAEGETQVPTINTVAQSFVPNVATTYKDDYFGVATNEMEPGLYTIMVEVDENGNKTFIWQAVQQARHITSVSGEMEF